MPSAFSEEMRSNRLRNIVHWYEFDDNVAADRIGGATFSHTNTVNSTAPNGRRCVATAAINGRMQSDISRIKSQGRGLQPFGVMVVTASNGNNNYFFDHPSATAPGNRPLAFQTGTNTIAAGSNVTGSARDNNWHVIYAEWNSPVSRLFIDGVLDAVGDCGQNPPDGSNFSFMDVVGGGGSAASGIKWAEGFVCLGVQSVRAVQGQTQMLRAKWGF